MSFSKPGVLIALAAAGPLSAAQAETGLAATELYKKLVHDCRLIDLASWRHPTREVLLKAGAKIEKVELCNAGKYPVFTVEFRYDPMTATDSYFNPLYAHMAEANGFNPFSFVAKSFSTVINVRITGRQQVTVDYEEIKS